MILSCVFVGIFAYLGWNPACYHIMMNVCMKARCTGGGEIGKGGNKRPPFLVQLSLLHDYGEIGLDRVRSTDKDDNHDDN